MVSITRAEKNGGAPEVISTDGGRYDVELGHRVRRAVYWEEEPVVIQRCSWFYKREGDNRYVPYDEAQADRLEVGARGACTCRLSNPYITKQLEPVVCLFVCLF